MTEQNSGVAYLEEVRKNFRGYKRMGEAALAQVQDAELFYQPDSESNNLAVIVKHVGGNLRSRWVDFLTTDGEKPDRNRDQEFIVDPGTTREQLMAMWETGWSAVFESLAGLKPEDLLRTVTIRQEPHTVVQAINRSLTHTAYHVGQIVYLGRHIRKGEWKTLSIPKGKSAEFNAKRPEERKYHSPHRG